MSKRKFKVGDKVIGNANAKGYSVTNTGWIGVITDISRLGNIKVDDRYWVNPDCFDLYTGDNKKIVITTDGVKTTTAKLYEDGKLVKTTEAKCAPEDTFDFMVGAKLACERLTKKKTPKPKYYNGKVICVSNSNLDGEFTVGKVYEIVDGKFTDNKRRIRPASIDRVIDLNDLANGSYFRNWYYKFIPLVED